MRIVRSFVLVGAVVCTLSACGGTASHPRTGSAPTATRSPSKSAAPLASETLRPVDGVVATAHGGLAVYASADASRPQSLVPAQTGFGSPTTLMVRAWEGPSGSWLEVALPSRPNGSTGYVRRADVDLAHVDRHVDVDLAARRLQVRDGSGAVLVDTPVAVGSPQNPTPTGDFFVTDLLDTSNAASAYGPYAFGLSAHSDTLTEFDGGDGQIGIHGTSDPSSIGNAVSHGCVRVPNAVAVQLASMLPLGTPVTIHSS